jgi:ElaB/YqjD/DUF883 family membrane-anchored ribosome-binding protein
VLIPFFVQLFAIIMEPTTSSNHVNAAIASPATPFPSFGDANDGARPNASVNQQDASAMKASDAAAAAAPIVDRLIKRATSSAHQAVDNVAAKVSSLTDGLQDGVAHAGDTRDEWVEAARDAIREHPFATVAGALVIGAALLSLISSRRD